MNDPIVNNACDSRFEHYLFELSETSCFSNDGYNYEQNFSIFAIIPIFSIFSIFAVRLLTTACYYVTHRFHSESIFCSCLNVKELLASETGVWLVWLNGCYIYIYIYIYITSHIKITRKDIHKISVIFQLFRNLLRTHIHTATAKTSRKNFNNSEPSKLYIHCKQGNRGG